MSWLTRISLLNRAVVALAAGAVVFFGVYAAGTLRQELLPDLNLPFLTVITMQPGAAPQDVERGLTTPLEAAVKTTADLKELSSYSNEGLSIIIAQYEFGTDMDETRQAVQDTVGRVAASLPAGAQPPMVESFNFQDLPVVQLAAVSPEGMSGQEFATVVQEKLVPRLQAIDGVAAVSLSGLPQQELRIQLRPADVARLGVAPESIAAALQSANSSTAAGTVDSGTLAYPITVATATDTVARYRRLALPGAATTSAATGPGMPGATTGAPGAGANAAGTPGATGAAPSAPGRTVTLGDVADVRVVEAPVTATTRTDGSPSVGIAVTKSRSGNTVEVSHAVQEVVDEFAGELDLVLVSDQADYIEESIASMRNEGLVGAVFAVLVIFLFLRSWRSTIVAGISIPLSVLGALVIMWRFGMSLNTVTLGGLTIAIGRVIDDAIVVLENTYRHLQEGDDARTAAYTGTREVAGAITASTLTTVAVFLPLGFVEGFSAEYFRPFGFTVTLALLASLLVAVTVVPALATTMLSKKNVGQRDATELTALQRGYLPVLRWALAHKLITVVGAFGLFFAVMSLGPLLEQNLFDSSGENSMSITQQLPPGTNLQTTERGAAEIEGVLGDTEGVQTYQVTIGSTGDLFGPGGGINASSGQAQFIITTDPEASKPHIVAEVRREVARLDPLRVGNVAVSGESGMFGANNLVEVRVSADDPAVLKQANERVLDAVKKVDGVTNVTSNLSQSRPQYLVDVDQAKAVAAGVQPASIAQMVSLIVSGIPMGPAPTEEGPLATRITVPRFGVSPQMLPRLPLPSAKGGTVPLGDVARVRRVEAPAQVTHIDGERTATVSATVESNNITKAAAEVQAALDPVPMPEGAAYAMAGAGEETKDVQRTLGIAMIVAVLLVYLIMVVTFRSLLNPLILLVSIPFAGVGAVLMLLLTGTSLGMPALIGLLMLVGIVVTNAIVLLDLIERFRRSGMDPEQAVIEGGRRRLRPILMTAAATILALTPMALGLGESAFLSTPLALTVIGGLFSSTFLTLVIVPVLYLSFSRLRGAPTSAAAFDGSLEPGGADTAAVTER